jgi:DnaJ-like protein
MSYAPALRVALELVHMPSRVRTLRSSPLPEGVEVVLKIAAGDEATAIEAAELSGRSREVVRNAAAFFIEQILFCPEADSYRVLGANRNATAGALRRNMALLMTWLHPDVDRGGERSIFAGRVTKAWEDLKTPDRRAAYDNAHGAIRKKKSQRQRNGSGVLRSLSFKQRNASPRIPLAYGRGEPVGVLRRLLWAVLYRPK